MEGHGLHYHQLPMPVGPRFIKPWRFAASCVKALRRLGPHISVGFNMAAPQGWSGFVRGNYQFADDYEAWSGNAGVRYAW